MGHHRHLIATETPENRCRALSVPFQSVMETSSTDACPCQADHQHRGVFPKATGANLLATSWLLRWLSMGHCVATNKAARPLVLGKAPNISLP